MLVTGNIFCIAKIDISRNYIRTSRVNGFSNACCKHMVVVFEKGVHDTCIRPLWVVWMGPLARYVKFRIVYAPGMLGMFSPLPRVSDHDMHHGTCVTHVPRCIPGLLTSGFLWSQWWGKRSRHSRRMHNAQFHVSGKRSIQHNKYQRYQFERDKLTGLDFLVPSRTCKGNRRTYAAYSNHLWNARYFL